MNLDEVEPFLQKLGLLTQITVNGYATRIRVFGDEIPKASESDLTAYRWLCYVWRTVDIWMVETPPLLCPGPGPEYRTESLAEAVHLVAYVFEHRQKIRNQEGWESYELACQLNEQFRREWLWEPIMTYRNFLADSLDQELAENPLSESRVFLTSSQIIQLGDDDRFPPEPVFVLAFKGTYRDGSLGRPDALNMMDLIKHTLADQPVSAVILDFSQLRYEWGDDLGKVILYPRVIGPPTIPLTMVVSRKCAKAIKSLRPFYASMILSLPDDMWIHQSQAEAIQYIRHRLLKNSEENS